MAAARTPAGTIRAVLYLRVSLDKTGEGLAVERQREDCLRILRERGWIFVTEYIDNSKSAYSKTAKRPDYDRMVEDYAAGQFDAIVCWDLDRLTRQPRQLEDWIDAAEERGLRLVTANGEADLTTDGGRMYARIKAAVARAEMERKGARQARAAQQRADQGHAPLGVRLTGYTAHGRLIVQEAAVVLSIFERFGQGESIKGITDSLNDKATPTRHGRPWTTSSVRGILKNPRYAGLAIYGGKETGQYGGWEPIIPESVFRLVQAKLSDPRRRTQQGTHRKHLGSGLYLCDECGGGTSSFAGRRYSCREGHLTRVQPTVDEYVTSVIRAALASPTLADLIPAEDSGRAAELAEQARALRARLEQTEHDYDADLIDARRFKAKSGKLLAELDQVSAERARLTGSAAASPILSAPDPVAAWDAEKSVNVRRAVLEALCTVRLRRAKRGSRTFDPTSVRVLDRSGRDLADAIAADVAA